MPWCRNHAYTFRYPTPWNGVSSITSQICFTNSASVQGPTGPGRRRAADRSCRARCRPAYTVERAISHTRHTRAKPYCLLVETDPWPLPRSAAVPDLGLQPHDLVIPYIPLGASSSPPAQRPQTAPATGSVRAPPRPTPATAPPTPRRVAVASPPLPYDRPRTDTASSAWPQGRWSPRRADDRVELSYASAGVVGEGLVVELGLSFQAAIRHFRMVS